MAKHLNYFVYIITNLPLTETTSSTAFPFAFITSNPAVHKEISFSTSKSTIYYCLVYLKVLFLFKPSQKAMCLLWNSKETSNY